MTTKDAIIKVLHETDRPLAVHEFGFIGANHAAISARLRELARVGIVVGERVDGRAYKAWSIASRGAISGPMIDKALGEPIYHPERWI